MTTNGRFGDSECLPVTGKDGKTVWIFKKEDLREVVSEEVYSVIEEVIEAEKEEYLEEKVGNLDLLDEITSDGFYNLCVSSREALGEILRSLEYDKARINRKRLIEAIRDIHKALDSNT